MDFNRQQATVTAVTDQYDQMALLKALEKEAYQGKVVKEGGGS